MKFRERRNAMMTSGGAQLDEDISLI